MTRENGPGTECFMQGQERVGREGKKTNSKWKVVGKKVKGEGQKDEGIMEAKKWPK